MQIMKFFYFTKAHTFYVIFQISLAITYSHCLRFLSIVSFICFFFSVKFQAQNVSGTVVFLQFATISFDFANLSKRTFDVSFD